MENNELKNIAPKLSEIKKTNPYQVPDNYFDKLPLCIQEKIETTESKPFKNILSILKPQLKLALGFIVLILTAYMIIQLVSNSNLGKESVSEIVTEDELLIYEDIDNEEIISILYDDSLNSDDFSEDDIIEYLIDDDIDYIAYLDEF